MTDFKANEKIKDDILNLKKNQELEQIKNFHNEPLTLVETTKNRDNCNSKKYRSVNLHFIILDRNYASKESITKKFVQLFLK